MRVLIPPAVVYLRDQLREESLVDRIVHAGGVVEAVERLVVRGAVGHGGAIEDAT